MLPPLMRLRVFAAASIHAGIGRVLDAQPKTGGEELHHRSEGFEGVGRENSRQEYFIGRWEKLNPEISPGMDVREGLSVFGRPGKISNLRSAFSDNQPIPSFGRFGGSFQRMGEAG